MYGTSSSICQVDVDKFSAFLLYLQNSLMSHVHGAYLRNQRTSLETRLRFPNRQQKSNLCDRSSMCYTAVPHVAQSEKAPDLAGTANQFEA